jgi:hypothetical protein
MGGAVSPDRSGGRKLMNDGLRERCRQFLERTPPPELGYVNDSIAGHILRTYAAGKQPDGELTQLHEIVIADSRATAKTLGGAASEYLLASAALLEEIASDR